MTIHRIGVAIAAAIVLLASITIGGGDALGLATDPMLVGVGAVGLMLALTTFLPRASSRPPRVASVGLFWS